MISILIWGTVRPEQNWVTQIQQLPCYVRSPCQSGRAEPLPQEETSSSSSPLRPGRDLYRDQVRTEPPSPELQVRPDSSERSKHSVKSGGNNFSNRLLTRSDVTLQTLRTLLQFIKKWPSQALKGKFIKKKIKLLLIYSFFLLLLSLVA